MDTTLKVPKTLLEAVRYFADPDNCLNFLALLRWPDGVAVCPRCGSKESYFLATRRLWKCKNSECAKQYTVKLGTIFEDSPIGLEKWLPAVWLIANCKNGASSWELHRALGITQKSAWFVLHRIRLAMQTGSFGKLSGEIEADESFIGGKARNMHKDRRLQRRFGKNKAPGPDGKAIVAAVLERHGEIRATVVPRRRETQLQQFVRQHVEAGSNLYTDALPSYGGLESEFVHKVIDHAEAYVNGRIHTNGCENF